MVITVIRTQNEYNERYMQFLNCTKVLHYFQGWPRGIEDFHAKHPSAPEGVILVIATETEDPDSKLLGVMELQFPKQSLAAMYFEPENMVGHADKTKPLIWFMSVDVAESARRKGVARQMYDALENLIKTEFKDHAVKRSRPGTDTPSQFTTWVGHRLAQIFQ